MSTLAEKLLDTARALGGPASERTGGDGHAVAPSAPKSREGDGRDLRDNVAGDGLLSQQAKDVRGPQIEAVAGSLQSAILESPVNERSEHDGGSNHGETSTGANNQTMNVSDLTDSATGHSAHTESEMREMMRAWSTWCDSEFATLRLEWEHYDLTSLASPTCETASATDEYFIERLLEATEESSPYSEPGTERYRLWAAHQAGNHNLAEKY